MCRVFGDFEDEVEEFIDIENGEDEVVLLLECYVEFGVYEQFLLMVFENGFGKCIFVFEYCVFGWGGKGIIVMIVMF